MRGQRKREVLPADINLLKLHIRLMRQGARQAEINIVLMDAILNLGSGEFDKTPYDEYRRLMRETTKEMKEWSDAVDALTTALGAPDGES